MSSKAEIVINNFYFNSLNEYCPSKEITESWCEVTIAEVLSYKFNNRNKYLYISEKLKKEHNPNKLFKIIHSSINEEQVLKFNIVTAENIKGKLRRRLPIFIFYIYYFFHIAFRRVAPKIKSLKQIWNTLKLPVDISKAEIVGRLIYNGFEVLKVKESNFETTITIRKSILDNPSLSKIKPSEGFVFKMKRLGLNGNKITVYKLRSMHPYAEYAQEYIYKMHGLDVGGKFKDDFRISTGGKLLRKYWIDELPMILNLLKGEIKLIGVRPISQHYFDLYPDKLKELRLLTKPGLLPPFYADMPKTLDEIAQSEINYIESYLKKPLITDFKYFVKILNNIFIKSVRSK